MVIIRNGRRLKAVCGGAQIPFSLDEPGGQGSLAVRLTTGSEALSHCMLFGGVVRYDAPAAAGGGGIFKALDAPEPTLCPEVASPSGAFLDVTSGVLD